MIRSKDNLVAGTFQGWKGFRLDWNIGLAGELVVPTSIEVLAAIDLSKARGEGVLEGAMEYDSTFVTTRRSKLTCHLTPTTIALVKQFSEFYAVEPDQLIESAIGSFIAQDKDFVHYLNRRTSGSV